MRLTPFSSPEMLDMFRVKRQAGLLPSDVVAKYDPDAGDWHGASKLAFDIAIDGHIDRRENKKEWDRFVTQVAQLDEKRQKALFKRMAMSDNSTYIALREALRERWAEAQEG